MTFTAPIKHQRGVSLVEAIVAMAVMAFGMIGVVGMQATLRGNADVARQRSEAVRLAQTRIEAAHAFSLISPGAGTPVPAPSTFDGIASVAAAQVVGEGTTYTIDQVVTDSLGTSADGPRTKTVVVTVGWTDRTAQQQFIQMSTLLAAVPLALPASLSLVGETGVALQRAGRNIRIPQSAVDLGNGTSSYTPPGAPAGVIWYFNNVTGSVCVTASCNATNPTDFNNRLLSGYVRFATVAAPVAGIGINPPGLLIGGLGVILTTPAPSNSTQVCYTRDELLAERMFYVCAVVAADGVSYSGRVNVTGLPLATSISDSTASRYRICRYTTVRAQAVVPTGIINENHPLDYIKVTGALQNQNFLVIPAGDGLVAYDCPEGLPLPAVPADPALPPPAGRTWHHQPAL